MTTTPKRQTSHFPSNQHRAQHVAPYAALLCTALAFAGCSSGSSSSSAPPVATIPATVPDFGAAIFSDPSNVNHPFFVLVPDTAATLLADSDDATETIIVEVLDTTRVVMGVECVVVRDRVFEDELLIEDTHDWYAQDDDGNVWYMGEEVDNYEYDDDGVLLGIDHDGAWEAGLDVAGTGSVAHPGHIMKAAPMIGDVYHQEYYAGEAEDQGEVIALAVPVTLADGSTPLCLQIRDSSDLDPGAEEDKFYAPGVGLVLESEVGGTGTVALLGTFQTSEDAIPDFSAATFTKPSVIDNPFLAFTPDTTTTFLGEEDDEFETIVVEVQEETRVVLGIDCAVVRDRVFMDELLIEDTFDWYAQDDDGNVWYMGEESVSFEYDDDGKLIGSDTEGSWEAGEDVAETGTIAEPGILVHAAPMPGASYHQEFYEDEAEDMAVVVRLDAEVELPDGKEFEDVLQVLEWNPLEPDALEYKFYVPGLGVVLEEPLHHDGEVSLRGTFHTGPGAVPDFAAASFTSPTVIDNELLPFPVGTVFMFEGEDEEGTETVIATVLAETREILGVTCAIVQEQEFLDEVLVEDTFDWYAQDDDGNVWYMGEDTISYEYDDEGKLEGTDTEGSWEAGEDVAGTGTIAEAGYLMKAAPAAGDSYHQEFYEEEAEDMAVVVRTGATVELSSGATYEDCLQTLEWNPLEPDSLEYKYYAAGVGLVLEESLTSDERLELTSVLGP